MAGCDLNTVRHSLRQTSPWCWPWWPRWRKRNHLWAQKPRLKRFMTGSHSAPAVLAGLPAAPRQLGHLAAIAILVVCSLPAHGASLQIDRRDGAQLTVRVNTMPSDAAVRALGQRFDFKVIRPAGYQPRPVRGTFRGTLDEIVARILRGTSFLIESRPGNRRRSIIKVRLFATPRSK